MVNKIVPNSDIFITDAQVRDLGTLMAVLTANAGVIESRRGALGLLNWVGDRLLLLSHLARLITSSS